MTSVKDLSIKFQDLKLVISSDDWILLLLLIVVTVEKHFHCSFILLFTCCSPFTVIAFVDLYLFVICLWYFFGFDRMLVFLLAASRSQLPKAGTKQQNIDDHEHAARCKQKVIWPRRCFCRRPNSFSFIYYLHLQINNRRNHRQWERKRLPGQIICSRNHRKQLTRFDRTYSIDVQPNHTDNRGVVGQSFLGCVCDALSSLRCRYHFEHDSERVFNRSSGNAVKLQKTCRIHWTVEMNKSAKLFLIFFIKKDQFIKLFGILNIH